MNINQFMEKLQGSLTKNFAVIVVVHLYTFSLMILFPQKHHFP